MTTLRHAATLALEALHCEKFNKAVTILREAPEQPEQQAEPVAWAVQACSKMWRGEFAEIDAKAEAKRIGGTCVAYPLYTTPPQRPWVGLTPEEVKHLYPYGRSIWGKETFEAIEKALREKNT